MIFAIRPQLTVEDMANCALGLYGISIFVFLFGALIQMRCKQRLAGYVTLLFVAGDIIIIFMLLPNLTRV